MRGSWFQWAIMASESWARFGRYCVQIPDIRPTHCTQQPGRMYLIQKYLSSIVQNDDDDTQSDMTKYILTNTYRYTYYISHFNWSIYILNAFPFWKTAVIHKYWSLKYFPLLFTTLQERNDDLKTTEGKISVFFSIPPFLIFVFYFNLISVS